MLQVFRHGVGGTLALMCVVASAAVRAECLIQTPASVLSGEIAVLGRVVSTEPIHDGLDLLATIEVERVWKGNPPARVTVFRDGLKIESPQFRAGERYVLRLAPLSPEQARARQLPETMLLAENCSGTLATSEVGQQLVTALGQGRSPR